MVKMVCLMRSSKTGASFNVMEIFNKFETFIPIIAV